MLRGSNRWKIASQEKPTIEHSYSQPERHGMQRSGRGPIVCTVVVYVSREMSSHLHVFI